MNTEISVIVPNYNKGAFILDALQSLKLQTFEAWEAIIVDDGSTDGSLSIAKTAFESDQRFKFFSHSRNLGIVKTLLVGFSKSRSEIICILDSDDALERDALQKMRDVFRENREVGCVLSQLKFCNSALVPWAVSTNTEQDLEYPLLWMRGSTAMRAFRREAFQKSGAFTRSLKNAEDFDLLFRLEEVTKVKRIPDAIYLYRQLHDSLSHSLQNWKESRSERAFVIYKAWLRRRRKKIASLPKEVVLAWLSLSLQNKAHLGHWFGMLGVWLRLFRVDCGYATLGLKDLLSPVLTRAISNRRDKRYLPFSLEGFQSATGNYTPHKIICIARLHDPGHAVYGGDFTIYRDANYCAEIIVFSQLGKHWDNASVVFDVYENNNLKEVIAEYRFLLSGGLQTYKIHFRAEEGSVVEFRAFWDGRSNCDFYGIWLQELDTIQEKNLSTKDSGF
jgi:glycosyltransferase involved in cell wall biosynthesis